MRVAPIHEGDEKTFAIAFDQRDEIMAELTKLNARLVVGVVNWTTKDSLLLERRVQPTLEDELVESPGYLLREPDENNGLPLLAVGV